jgi:hypothetical protein
MRYLGTLFDSPEIKSMVAELAQKNDAPRVVLRPDALHIWEYDRDGNVVKSDVPSWEMTREGKRVYCYPELHSDQNLWYCFLYNEDNKVVSEGKQVFPR